MIASHLCLRTALPPHCCRAHIRSLCTVSRFGRSLRSLVLQKPLVNRSSSSHCTSKRAAQLTHLHCAATGRNSARVGTGVDLGYRRNVGVCLINTAGLVFAARRLDDSTQTWQMPQGGIDEGEDPRAAAVRELREETGISSASIIAEHPEWLQYDFPPEVLALWREQGHHRGQRQKWFLMLFEGDDSEVDLDQHEPEFSEFKWVDIHETPLHVVPFKRDVYEAVVEEFAPLIAARHANGRDNSAGYTPRNH